MTVYYHRTDAADAILSSGFRDASGSYMLANSTLTGVFVSDVPLDVNEGATGGQLLVIELPSDVDLSDFELVEDGKPYREWCVPADLLNARGSVRLLAEADEDAIGDRCAAITRKGRRCRGVAIQGGLCAYHNPTAASWKVAAVRRLADQPRTNRDPQE